MECRGVLAKLQAHGCGGCCQDGVALLEDPKRQAPKFRSTLDGNFETHDLFSCSRNLRVQILYVIN